MESLALFKSHYSLCRSVLTSAPAGESDPLEPDSIVDLAVEAKLDKCVVIDDSLSGFLEIYTNLNKAKVSLIFGYRVTIVPNLEEKNEESLEKESKIIVLAKNLAGYKKLIKISTKASTDGFYYQPRIDYKNLKELFSDDLQLIIPFYDSYLFKNTLTFSQIVPDFGALDPYYFVESNGLPFDGIIEKKVRAATSKIILAKSIYYKNRADFTAYMTLRCLSNRTTLEKPNLTGMFSNEFCFESWKEQNAR